MDNTQNTQSMNTNKLLTIDHVDNSASILTAAIHNALTTHNREDIIVLNTENPEQLKEQLQVMRDRGIGIQREPQPFVITNNYYEDGIIVDTPGYHKKQHKPNKGFKLGGYRYKGR